MNRGFLFIVVLVLLSVILAKKTYSYEDHSHYSRAFEQAGLNPQRFFRIFLPEDYETSGKRYPVIYVFHGYGGRYDISPQINIVQDHIDALVKKRSVILVMWNGRVEPDNKDPYNNGASVHNVKYSVQYKDYFLELLQYIDETFPTIADRTQRGLFGHSQGGFLSWFIAGKYPDKIGAAINNQGSPKHLQGRPGFETPYVLQYFSGNYHGLHVKLQNSTYGFLCSYNGETHQAMLREKGLSYEYKTYPGPHQVDDSGQIKVFKESIDYLLSCFQSPLPKPVRWHHLDAYPEFTVWDYEVSSNISAPGFVELHGVTKGGLRIQTRQWLPDGRLIPGIDVKIKTAPIYIPGTKYTLLDYNVTRNTREQRVVTSDDEGRISISANHEVHHFGLFRKSDPAEIVLLSHAVDRNKKFLYEGRENRLGLRLLNRGGQLGKKIKVSLSTSAAGVEILNPMVRIGDLETGIAALSMDAFKIKVTASAPKAVVPWQVRFNLSITDEDNNNWNDEIDVPVFYDSPEFSEVSIDDGRQINWKGKILGTGNGNGIVEPGETVVLYTGDNRLRLFYDDPFVDSLTERVYLEPISRWIEGIKFSSVVQIKKNCPPGHKVEFLAEYIETKQRGSPDEIIKHERHWGKVSVQVGPSSPFLTSALQVYVGRGQPFTYQLTFSNPNDNSLEIDINKPGWLQLQKDNVFYGYVPSDFDEDVIVIGMNRKSTLSTSLKVVIQADTTAPVAPRNLRFGNNTDNVIRLFWGNYWTKASDDPESGVAHYNIYRNGQRIGHSLLAEYSDEKISSGNEYQYQITAVNSVGLESEKTNLISVIP